MRLDKFLKVSRLIKRRTVAQSACSGARIEVNGKTAKPGYQVKEGDVLTIHFGEKPLCVRVLKVSESVRREEADALYEVI